MTNASCVLNGKHLGYFFAVMGGLIIMLYLMFTIAIDPSPQKVFRAFTLIILLSLIMFTSVWLQRQTIKGPKTRDYSLK